jgi:hypothetical protein
MLQMMCSILDSVWGKVANTPTIGFIDFITDTGAPGGTYNMVGDYSLTPTDFYIQPPENSWFYLSEVQFQISISSTPSRTEYGSINALTNGIMVFQRLNGVERILNPGGHLIKNNTDIVLFGAHTDKVDFGGINDIYIFSIPLGEDKDSSLVLRGRNNDRFGLRLSDDFTGIEDHRLIIRGKHRIVGAI